MQIPETVSSGQLFFALKGENCNGNQFAKGAIENGAIAAIIDEEEFFIDSEKTLLVENCLETLQALAQYHREQYNIPVIAITGSNGKTTSKELINAVLTSQYKVCCTQGNLNNHIGVPLTLLRMKKGDEIALIEMGANHCGEIESYCRWVQPTIGIISNIGKAHLEGFGGIEGVIRGKTELYKSIEQRNQLVFVNGDDPLLMDKSNHLKRLVYGSKQADFLFEMAEGKSELLRIYHIEHGVKTLIKSQLTGDYNFSNIALAVSLGRYFKMDIAQIATAIAAYTPTNSRSQIIKKGRNTIILDAYNANPSSMEEALKNLAAMPQENKVAMIGGMKELGNESAFEHRRIIKFAQQFHFSNFVLVGMEFKEAALELGLIYFETSDLAKTWFQEQSFENTVILIKGSRGTRMEKVIE
ncbi:MAG: UDP-N-acetylmuramoyl-tripeptide--D-alanyl-D-alanine ligase [Bacteroidetes bacterium]|nr:UDP-N-acetylmuramoyl-tripeptide--D-alanyl-D-alanine ligase [Bacteroidota bacterium]